MRLRRLNARCAGLLTCGPQRCNDALSRNLMHRRVSLHLYQLILASGQRRVKRNLEFTKLYNQLIMQSEKCRITTTTPAANGAAAVTPTADAKEVTITAIPDRYSFEFTLPGGASAPARGQIRADIHRPFRNATWA